MFVVIAGQSPFVGLDNFIHLALDQTFWASMGRTVYFVFLNLVLVGPVRGNEIPASIDLLPPESRAGSPVS